MAVTATMETAAMPRLTVATKAPASSRRKSVDGAKPNAHTHPIRIRYKVGSNDLLDQMCESERESAAAVASLRAFRVAFSADAAKADAVPALGLLDDAAAMALAYLSFGDLRARLTPSGISYLRRAARSLVGYRHSAEDVAEADADAVTMAAAQAACTIERIYTHDVRVLKMKYAIEEAEKRLRTI